MNLHEQQLWSDDQREVLRLLAESASKKDCLFLEVGSWCGDSTVVIGKVVREAGGHLICVDWWKGNPGTDLYNIAMDNDVYNAFWERISAESLSDNVIPVRAESGIASSILKEKSFDFVFLDGDHRYEGVLSDIKKYMPLVKEGGILCGHDCEGYIDDFGREFLESGKLTDFHEGVHCGVVLAVGESFADYSIEESIWSVRLVDGKWKPAVDPANINDESIQAIIPPLGYVRDHYCYRYKKHFYAIPLSNGDKDVRKKEVRVISSVISADSIKEIETILEGNIDNLPNYTDEYSGYNIIEFKGRVYGILQSLGDIDLINIENNDLQEYIDTKKIFVKNSIYDALNFIEKINIEIQTDKIQSENKTSENSIDGDLGVYLEELRKNRIKIKKLENDYSKARALIDKLTNRYTEIVMIESLSDYNIMKIDDRYAAFSKSIGYVDLFNDRLAERDIADLIFIESDLEDLKERIKKASLENYKKTIMIEDYQTLKEALKKKNLRAIINALSKIKKNEF